MSDTSLKYNFAETLNGTPSYCQRCTESDPVAYFFSNKLRLTPKLLAIYVLAWSIAINIFLPMLIMFMMPATYTNRGWIDYSRYFAGSGLIVFNLLIPPFIAGYYLWLTGPSQKLVFSVIENKNLQLDAKGKETLIRRLDSLFSKPWAWRVMILTLALFVTWYFTSWHSGLPQISNQANSIGTGKSFIGYLSGKIDIGVLSAIPWILFGAYWTIMIIIRGIQNIYSLWIIFRNTPMSIEPLHPDRCGGLRLLNSYVIRLSYLIGVAGFGLGLLVLASSWSEWTVGDLWIYFMIGLYIVLAPAFFFQSLGPAHQAMKASKDQYLDMISKRFQDIYSKINEYLKKDTSDSPTDNLKIQLEQLNELDILYKRTEAFPVWPLDTGSILRFARTIGISLAPTIVSIAVRIYVG